MADLWTTLPFFPRTIPAIDWLAFGPLLAETNSSGGRLVAEDDEDVTPRDTSGCGLGVEVAGVAMGGMVLCGGVADSCELI